MIHILTWLNSYGFAPPWDLLLVVAIGILGVGRLARLITYDAFPPSVWWRKTWAGVTAKPDGSEGSWEKLFTCYWCLTPWLVLVAGVALYIAWDVLWLAVIWLVFFAWLGISYVISMIVNRDERD